jgi:predicted CopG family antitoxin
MHGACMATKTISIDLPAYERLTLARAHDKESFSQVIKRALWPKSRTTGKDLLVSLKSMPRVPAEILDGLDANQALDKPPADKWR